MKNTEADAATKRFIQEFEFDIMTAYAFDEEHVAGIKGQGLAADMLTGDVGLFVTLKGDPDGRPLQLVDMPFYNSRWGDEEAVAALEHHLGLSAEEALLRRNRPVMGVWRS